MTEMVRLDRLAKRFGPVRAVEEVSFGLERGEVLGFLGPNGAGKSTTMRMLTGFIPPSAGTRQRDGLRRGRASRSRPSSGSATCRRARRSTAT